MRKWILLSGMCLFLFACKGRRDQRQLAEAMCDCAKPVMEWKNHLTSDPSSLSDGGAIEVQLRDCLTPYKEVFSAYASDTSFVYELANRINKDCPEANTTVNAMLLILANEK